MQIEDALLTNAASNGLNINIKRALLIFNPKAGDTRSMRMLPHAIEQLSNNGYICTVVTTTGPRVATEYVATLGASHELVVCSGGDGTVNEVIKGLMQLPRDSRPRIGYLPAGSTNDFSVALGLPKRTEDMIATLTDGECVPLDIGEFNGMGFAYVAAFGAFTEIAHTTPQDAKNTWGFLAYLVEGMIKMKNIRPIKARFTINGEVIDDTFIFCSISNSTIIAGVLKLKPEWVDLNDGLFEVILIKYPPNAIMLGKIVSALAKGDYCCEYIRMFHAREIEVEFPADEQVPWTLDGECFQGSRHIKVNVNNSAVNIMLDPNSNDDESWLFDKWGL